MPDTVVVHALYAIPAEELEPLRIWEVVQEQLGVGYEPVTQAELEDSLAEMGRRADDVGELTRGQQLEWKWLLGAILVTLRRALDHENLTIIELTASIRAGIVSRQWRFDTFFYDRFATQRAHMIDICARLMMQVAADDWLIGLLNQSGALILSAPTVGHRISRRRRSKLLTVAELAREMKVSRTTANRWEKGTIPHPQHREALAALLGGEPSDYA